jgi:hypothetical protein
MNYKTLLTTLCLGCLACSKEDDNVTTPVEKLEHRVEFRVSRAKDYIEPIYDSAKATVNLAISLENMQDGKNTILWDTAFSVRSLREYPAPQTPLVIRKDISRMVTGNEVLRLSNTTRYFDRNNTTWMAAESETVPRNMPFISIEIGL